MSLIKQSQFIQAVKFICDNLAHELTLGVIANEVGCSVASLKRLFFETVEQSPGQFVRRLRMEHAFKYLHQNQQSVLAAALEIGFDDHAAFSRAFKQCFGYAPKQARKQHNIVSELKSVTLSEPDIVEVDDIFLQVSTEVGSYFEAAPKAWENLKKTLPVDEKNDDSACIFFGVGHDNPHRGDVAINAVRFSAGISMAKPNDALEKICLPKGRYARFRYVGKLMNLGLAYHYIFGQWNETNNCSIDCEKLAFTVIDHLPKNGVEHEELQIWVPLET